MSTTPLSVRDLRRVASRFKVLAEPARLRVLQCLQHGPQHVSALMDATGLRQANLSKHLQTLHAHGLVGRARAGRFIHYAIADPAVLALCDLMCRQMAATPALSRTASRPRGPSASPSRSRPARRPRTLSTTG